MKISWLAFVLSVMMFLFVLELVRRHRLTFKYAMAWLVVAALGAFFAIFHQLLFDISVWFGFELPSNFIFFILFGVFIFLTLLMTVFLCQQNNRNDRMAQKIALIETKLDQFTNPQK